MDKALNKLTKLALFLGISCFLLGAISTAFLAVLNPKPVVKYSPEYFLINKPKKKDTVVYIVTKDTIMPW